MSLLVLAGFSYLSSDHSQASIKEITCFISEAWSQFAIQQINRKGVGEHDVHYSLTSQVFSKLSKADQHIIALNLVGGYQTESQKAIWASDCTGLCPLCQAKDHHQHNPLECKALLECRIRHPLAIKILTNERPEWMYMILGRQHPKVQQSRLFSSTIAPPKSLPLPSQTRNQRIFYTDGGAIHPKDPFARLASWSVVEDLSQDESQRQQITSCITEAHRKIPMFHSCGVGLVHGNQTAGRGELVAMTLAVESAANDQHCSSAKFFTDAQYVVNIIANIDTSNPSDLTYKHPNPDLVCKLQRDWQKKPFTVHKLKSHRGIEEATDENDLWNLLGNKMADIGATSVLEQLPDFIKSLSHQIAKFHADEKQKLKAVMEFYADMNRTRVKKIAEQSKLDKKENENDDLFDKLMPAKISGEAVFDFLETFDVIEYAPLVPQPFELTTYHACFQGANLAKSVHLWCETLRWPREILDKQDYNRKDYWGISWLELVFNFCLCSQQYFPIRISGRSTDSCYISYTSDEALLAYGAKRAVHMQTLCMERMIRALENLQEKKIFPSFRSNQCKSLIRYGYTGKHTGIPCRPVMQKQKETIQWVKKYMHNARIKGSLTDPFSIPNQQATISFEQIPELPACERWKKYFQLQDIKRRARKAAAANQG